LVPLIGGGEVGVVEGVSAVEWLDAAQHAFPGTRDVAHAAHDDADDDEEGEHMPRHKRLLGDMGEEEGGAKRARTEAPEAPEVAGGGSAIFRDLEELRGSGRVSGEVLSGLETCYGPDGPRTAFLLFRNASAASLAAHGVPVARRVGFAVTHAQAEPRALAVPTRSILLPDSTPAAEGATSAAAEDDVTAKASAAGGGGEEYVPWRTEIFSVGTVRREDWFGGGKTAQELQGEMVRRFASGSFRVPVMPTVSWARELRPLVAHSLTVRPETLSSTLRLRKVVAGPNRDLFLLLERA
jgi:hypothetical protein